MRFLQISDLRAGADPESEKSWGRQRAAEIRDGLKRAADLASAEGCDLLLVAGGLFCHQPVTSELAEVNRLFLAYPGLQVVIAAGAVDPLRRNAPARSFKWAPNVHFAGRDGLERFYFPGIGTSVYAASCGENGAVPLSELVREYRESYEAEERAAVKLLLLPELLPETKTKINAGAQAAQSLPGACPAMERQAAEQTDSRTQTAVHQAAVPDTALSLQALLEPFSYAAVGGGAQHAELLQGKAYCAGTAEPLSMQETGEHGVYIGDISSVTGRLIDISFRATAAASYVPLLVNVTEQTGAGELEALLRSEMDQRGKQNIYRLRIAGRRSPETVFDLKPLFQEYRIAELLDETVPQYDLSALFAEHPQDMIGFYISSLQREADERSSIEEKAMYYGIDALLKTAK